MKRKASYVIKSFNATCFYQWKIKIAIGFS